MIRSGALATWFLIFVTYSVAGWCLEVVSTLVLKHKFTNRGFMIGPMCPIYGFGAVIMSLCLHNVDNIFAIFVVAILASAVLEYATSFVMEKLFRVRWWDYSKKPFNIRGRICLENLFYFGVLGIFVVKLVNPLLFAAFESLAPTARNIVAGSVFIVMVGDYMMSLWLVVKCRVAVGTINADATDEITANIRNLLMDKGKLNRRLAKAFPTMQAKKKAPRKKKTSVAAMSQKLTRKKTQKDI